MKILISLAAVAGVGLMTTPAAAQGAWCAEDYGPSAYRNCGYYTLEQCRAGASGVGGHCYPSPWASRGTVIEPRKRTKRSKRDR
jgi:Protein of unknown function (DUF3551)